jgi:hypothetical protein
MLKVDKTYSLIIPESIQASNGEYSDEGFEYEDRLMTVNELLLELNCDCGYCELNVTNQHNIELRTIAPDIDYSTGHETYYSWHIDGTDEEITELTNKYGKYCE